MTLAWMLLGAICSVSSAARSAASLVAADQRHLRLRQARGHVIGPQLDGGLELLPRLFILAAGQSARGPD